MTVPLVPLDSVWSQTLDGLWAFQLLGRPEDVAVEHVAADTDDSAWARLAVPGNWTMQGYDRPHYTNVRMPFQGPPPAVPEANPTGAYRRMFRIPPGWRGRCVHLEVGGAESVLYVYCNGAFVGSGTDSRLASSFDLTSFLQRGRNVLACVVVRWSAQSYVEDQDQWWMAGLHRTVRLVARPPVRLADARVRAGLRAATTGTLVVDAEVSFGGGGPEAGWSVAVDLEDETGRRLLRRPLSAEVPHDVRPYVFEGHVARLRTEVSRVRPWSAEQPQRYRAVVTLLDPTGHGVDATVQVIGFRTVEVRDGLLQVNGRPITIHGVNRHDHHPDRGKAVTTADIRADLVAMKRHNIDAVRTSHYPNDSSFLDLCDELGLYVIDEADIEAHAYNTSLCHNPRYRATWIERAARMVARDRNHPCVIAWSLGNESGHGPHHDALAAWIRREDPTRPLHYEGGVAPVVPYDPSTWSGGADVTDVVCPMYPAVEWIQAWATAGPHDRPLIMCEYSHAMGNSNGGLADYWAVIGRHRQLQGGFLWEWKDHGLRQRLADGRERFAYGGQFGDEPNDANFVADGLCSPDLRPHPALREVAWVYRPVAIARARGGLRIENRQVFRDLSWLEADWELTVEGEPVGRGRLRLPAVAPGRSVVIPLPRAVATLRPRHENHFTVRVRTRRDETWAPAGHLLAWDQVRLGARRRAVRSAAVRDGVVASIDDDGRLSQLAVDGHDLLVTPVELSVWRAPTDNDGFKLRPRNDGKPLQRWLDAGLDALERTTVSVRRRADGAVALHEWRGTGAESVQHRQRITVHDGGVTFDDEVLVPASLADLPRIGASFLAAPGFDRVRWYGLGPHENYPDRQASAMVGIHSGAPDELPYLMPQEFGLRCGVRWWELTSSAAFPGLRIVADRPAVLAVSATHHTSDDLFAARDRLELARWDEVVVHVDVAHRGVGTASCGPDTALRHRLRAGRWRWRWRLEPVDPEVALGVS